MLINRKQAASLLATKLHDKVDAKTVLLAIPGGGVVLGHHISNSLNLPLDVTLCHELGHPANPNFAIGDIGLQSRFVMWSSYSPIQYIEEETKKIQHQLLQEYHHFTGRDEPISLFGRSVVLVDDALWDCQGFLQNIRVVRKTNPAKIIVAVASISSSCKYDLMKEVDQLVFLEELTSPKSIKEMCPNFEEISTHQIHQVFSHDVQIHPKGNAPHRV